MKQAIIKMNLAALAVVLAFSITNCKKETDVLPTPDSSDSIVNIPDSIFKATLVNNSLINTNGNSEIELSEATSYTGIISAPSRFISSAEGIQSFTNVTRIALYDNLLTEIDLSNNTKVTQLLLEENYLTTLDASNLSQLVDFKAHTNNLTKVNLANGNNANMWRVDLQANSSLTCIQVDALPVRSGWSVDSTSAYSTNCF